MDTIVIRGEDRALSDALAGILGRLRVRFLGPFRRGPQEVLFREPDGFVEGLARHVRHAEEEMFPALRKLGLESAGEIKTFREDHRILEFHARDLVRQVRDKDMERACGIARSFLAVLLDHLRRETSGSGRGANALGVSDTERRKAHPERSCLAGGNAGRFEPETEAKPRGGRSGPQGV